jgi:hypothetical protein
MSMPQTCEVGDLSGKHGKIEGMRASKKYVQRAQLVCRVANLSFGDSFMDVYAALVPGIGAFFGNRSIVIHSSNSTRLACANFTMVKD